MELKRELTERQRALLWLSAAEVTSERVRQLTEEFEARKKCIRPLAGKTARVLHGPANG